MKKNTQIQKNEELYCSPTMELIRIETEKGFAFSDFGDGDLLNSPEHWNQW